MFQFSPSQKTFIKNGLFSNFRVDGRSLVQRRNVDVKRNILDNLAGSSYVSVNHGKSEIYTGIKIKVSQSNEGVIPKNSVTLELSSMHRLDKQAADCLAYLQQILQQHYVDREVQQFTQLIIHNSKKHFLQMHIQVFILSEPHLSLLETLFLSIKSALQSTSLPNLECFWNDVTNEESVQLQGNDVKHLDLKVIDSIMVIGCLEGKFIADMTPLEYESVQAVYLIILSREKIVGIQSLKGSINSEEIHRICRFALNNIK